MRWAGHVARMGKISAYKLLLEIRKGRNHSEDVDERIILKWTLGKMDGKLWTGFM
jgi:hypothetical protein